MCVRPIGDIIEFHGQTWVPSHRDLMMYMEILQNLKYLQFKIFKLLVPISEKKNA